MRPRTTGSAAFSCCGESSRPSERLDAGTLRMANGDSRRGKLVDADNADIRTRPASDRPPNSPRKLPPLRIAGENRAKSWEMAGAARAHPTDCGRLKQPDKQEPANEPLPSLTATTPVTRADADEAHGNIIRGRRWLTRRSAHSLSSPWCLDRRLSRHANQRVYGTHRVLANDRL
jgi:hypothetical protein